MAMATLSEINSPYFGEWKAYPITNPSGVMQMGLAENQLSFDFVEEPEVVHPAIIYQGDGTALQGATVGGRDGTFSVQLSKSGRRNQDRRIIELNFFDNCTPKDQLSLYRRLFGEYPQIYPAEESRIGLQTTDSHLNQRLGDNFVS